MSGRATIRLRLTSSYAQGFRLPAATTWPAFVRLRHGRRVGV